MTRTKWLLVAVLLAALGATAQFGPGLTSFDGSPVRAVVVRESADVAKLTQDQIAWMNSKQLRMDAKAKGITLQVVDPDVQDANKQTPADLAPAIAAAQKVGLPRIVLVGPRGGTTVYPLPATEADARKRLGL